MPSLRESACGASEAHDPGLSDFACEFLRGLAGQNQFRGMAYGQTRPGLSLINVSHARVAFPSSSERNTIADVGKSLHKAIEENRTEWNRLRSLKASTAAALLTGRMRVADYQSHAYLTERFELP